MIFTNASQLSSEVNKYRKGRKVVLATGTFDLFHYDHLKYLEGAKKEGNILIVAVKNNECATLKNPQRPIIDEKHRIAIVDAIKYVDYTILVDYDPSLKLEIGFENEKQHQWLIMFEKLFKTLRPDVLYYENNPSLQSARDKVCNLYGISGIMKERGESASTTDIIKCIKAFS